MKKNGRDKEREILDAAIRIFSQKGFSAATTSEIAKEANIAEGTIFRYYPKKKSLLHAAIMKGMDLFGESIAIDSLKKVIEQNKDKSPEEFLKAVVMERAKLFKDYLPLLKVIFYEIQFHEDARELFYSKITKFLFQIAEEIYEILNKNHEFQDIQPMIVLRSFIGINIFMLIQREFFPQKNVYENIEDEIEQIIEIFLNGIRRR